MAIELKKRKKQRRANALRRDLQLYLLLLLPVVYFLVFKYGPMFGLVIAFKQYNIFQGIWKSPWIGFEAFKEIFHMRNFYAVLRNTFMLNILNLVFSLPAPIIVAIMLHELRIKWLTKTSQSIIYLPHFISWVIIGGMVYQLFATNSGMVDNIISMVGLQPVPFLTNQYWWIFTYLMTGIWQSVGWGSILYLAALAGINHELYEAADMDGASRLRKIWHVTLPGLRPTIIMLLIINVGNIAQIGFDKIYNLQNVLVLGVSDVLSTFVYRVGLQSGQYTIATAVGFFQALVGLFFILSSNYISRKLTDESIL